MQWSRVLGLLTVAAGAFFFLQIGAQVLPFDCRRASGSCAFSTDVCQDDGTCACSDNDRSGYDCSLNLTTLADSANSCGPPCVKGRCLEGNKCYCDADSVGSRCDKNRVSVECSLDSMKIMLHPNSGPNRPFTGRVQIVGMNMNAPSSCMITNPVGSDMYMRTLMYSDCGGAINTTTDAGDRKYSYRIIVMYNFPIIHSIDPVYNAACIIRQSDSNFTFTAAVALTPGPDPDEENVDNEFSPVTFTVHKPGSPDDELTSVIIGDYIVLDFQFAGGDEYSDFMVVSVEVSDGKGESIILLYERCPQSQSGINVTLDESPNSALVTFQAFKFVNSNSLQISSMVKICKDGACEAKSCDPVSRIARRRRRDVTNTGSDDSEVTYRELDATIRVGFPSRQNSDSTNKPVLQTPEERCRQSLTLLILAGLLGCLLILTTGTCLFFFVRMRQATRNDVREKPFSKMDDNRSYS